MCFKFLLFIITRRVLFCSLGLIALFLSVFSSVLKCFDFVLEDYDSFEFLLLTHLFLSGRKPLRIIPTNPSFK